MEQLKFTVEQAIEHILPVAQLASTKSQLPIFNAVLIKVKNNIVYAISSNGNQTLFKPLIRIMTDDFEVCFDGEKLRSILSGFKNNKPDQQITLSWNATEAVVKIGRSKLKLDVIDALTYPAPIKLNENAQSISVNSEALNKIIKGTYHAIGLNDVRSYLNGLHLNICASGINITTADGHRLSQYHLEQAFDLDEDIAIIVPKDMIKWITAIPDGEQIKLSTDGRLFQIIWSSGQIRSNLLDGKFPDVTPLFATETKKQFNVNKRQFLEGLKRLKATVYEKLPVLTLESTEGELKIATRDSKKVVTGEDYINAQLTNEFCSELCININYLDDAISSFDNDDIQIEHAVEKGFIKIKDSLGQKIDLVMPITI